MSEFSKKSALVSKGFIGIKHDARHSPPRSTTKPSAYDKLHQAKRLGWAFPCLSSTISLVLVLMKSVREACNKAFQSIVKEISWH